jgi:hypothetical protein
MLAEGINAFDRLMWHWENTTRFVLIVRDGSRFSRTQTMHAFVTETTMEAGSNIYSLQDGLIDEHNYRMFTAMNGYGSASEIDRLVKGREREMDRRVKVGLPTSSRVIMSHIPIHDPITRKVIRIDLNQDLRGFWDDLATLLLDGVAYHRIGGEMYKRFGHLNPKTKRPYRKLYQTLMSPTFWGHSGRHLADNSEGAEHWRLEEGHPLPDGVLMTYNTHEPVYKGELAQKIIAEIKRRSLTKGSAGTEETYAFSGLLLCDECHRHMQTSLDSGLRVKCRTHWFTWLEKDCSQRKSVRYEKIQPYVHSLIVIMLERNTTEIFSLPSNTGTSAADLASEINELREHLENLILDKASARTPTSKAIYNELIRKDEERLEILEAALRKKQHAEARLMAEPRQMALREMDAIGLEEFWKRESRYQNQLLHRLFGDWRLTCRDGEISGAALKPVHWLTERKQNRRKNQKSE